MLKVKEIVHHHFVETNSNNLSLKGKKSFREEILSLHNASSTERIFISSHFSLGLHFSSRANTSGHHLSVKCFFGSNMSGSTLRVEMPQDPVLVVAMAQ